MVVSPQSAISTLDGVPFKVLPPITESIERHSSNVTFERAKTRSYSVSRGVRSIKVRAKVYSDSVLDDLRALFNVGGEATGFFDDRQRNRYTGTYILGSLELEDESQSSSNITVSFDLTETAEIDDMATQFDITAGRSKPTKEAAIVWNEGTIAPASSARGTLITSAASAQSLETTMNAEADASADPTVDTTAFTTGDVFEAVGWLTLTGFSDLSANHLMGIRFGDGTVDFTKTATARDHIVIGADSTGVIYLVSANGSAVTAKSTGITAVSGTRFKYRLTATIGSQVRLIINDGSSTYSKVSDTEVVPDFIGMGNLGWGTSGAVATKTVLSQGGMSRFTPVA